MKKKSLSQTSALLAIDIQNNSNKKTIISDNNWLNVQIAKTKVILFDLLLCCVSVCLWWTIDAPSNDLSLLLQIHFLLSDINIHFCVLSFRVRTQPPKCMYMRIQKISYYSWAINLEFSFLPIWLVFLLLCCVKAANSSSAGSFLSIPIWRRWNPINESTFSI